MANKTYTKLLDNNINSSNYTIFRNCYLDMYGKIIIFEYPNRIKYVVPIDFLLTWFEEPHFIKINNKWREYKTKYKICKKKDISIMKCKFALDKHAIKIILNNNVAYTVPWDTVLMACEPNYEHFGGLTTNSNRIVNNFLKNYQIMEFSAKEIKRK